MLLQEFFVLDSVRKFTKQPAPFAELDRNIFYICHRGHPFEQIFTENVVEFLDSAGVGHKIISMNPSWHRPELQECLRDDALGVLGFNAQLDQSRLGARTFLSKAEEARVPVIQWVVDHPAALGGEFGNSTATNSSFLFLARSSEDYFRRHVISGAMTRSVSGLGRNKRSRMDGLSRQSFLRRNIACTIPVGLRRFNSRTFVDSQACIDELPSKHAQAIKKAARSGRYDLTQSVEVHLAAALDEAGLRLPGEAFHSSMRLVEELIQGLRRHQIFDVARDFPVLVQSDENARSLLAGGVATLREHVSMAETIETMKSSRAVLNVNHVSDLLHDRTLNGLNAGSVNLVEDSAFHRTLFRHGENALLFRYHDNSLRECLDLVCNEPERAYEIAAAGSMMRDDQPFRFGGFHNMVELAQADHKRKNVGLSSSLKTRHAALDTPFNKPTVVPQNTACPARHTFQSFWAGEELSLYEMFCMKSFIDCGYEFDLYTFDTKLTVPAGVRVRDAAELFRPAEFFVYEEGFGAGSPAAFANMFRYKLLFEKGGWWTDTDVVCLSGMIPKVTEFFARQDTAYVNTAIMYFEPGHPVMARCFQDSVRKGRKVKWGDTGPHLLSQIVQEMGYADRALPPSICYPVYHAHALEVLRPSQAATLAHAIEHSLFLHLWNAVLAHRGIQKTHLPPKGSLLRGLIDRHWVEGWTNEYDEVVLEQLIKLHAKVDAGAHELTDLRNKLEIRAHEVADLQNKLNTRAREVADLRNKFDTRAPRGGPSAE
jgi:hypothetical protein